MGTLIFIKNKTFTITLDEEKTKLKSNITQMEKKKKNHEPGLQSSRLKYLCFQIFSTPSQIHVAKFL